MKLLASLDTENEIYIIDSLRQMAKDRRIIIIAHRLQSIQNSDWIYMIKDGYIKEQGKHDEVRRKMGISQIIQSAGYFEVKAPYVIASIINRCHTQ